MKRAVLAAALAALAAGCGAGMSAATLDQREMRCVVEAGTRPEAEACRAAVRKDFCARNPGVGAFCVDGVDGVDGGAE